MRIGLEARIPRSEIERLVGKTDERLLVLYGRVSGQGQREDLETQLARLEQWAKIERPDVPCVVLSGIGSGLKPTRKQLTRLLKMVCQDRVGEITLGSLGFTKSGDKPIHTEKISLISSVEICSPGRFSFKMSEPWAYTVCFRRNRRNF